MNKRLTLTGLILLIVMIAGAGCSMAPAQRAEVAQAAPVAQATLATGMDAPDVLAAYEGTLQNIYQAVSPSVVNIRVVSTVETPTAFNFPGFPFFNSPNSQPQQQYATSLGSGFTWDTAGHIITNNHVIDGADKIEVTFSDGTVVEAQVVGTDPDSDLAVIQVDAPAELLVPIGLADSNSVEVGQLAIAIGDPFGLAGTMTAGIVSAVGRSLPVGTANGTSYTIPDVIQTDAPINPGNSGGVLVNDQGLLIGVTSAIESPVRANAGIGFAIPSAIVNNVVPALIDSGTYEHAWLGISGTTLTPSLAEAMDLDAQQRGVLIADILPDSPAESAGLHGSTDDVTIDGLSFRIGGDVITAIDGQPVKSIDELIAYLASKTQVDQKITLTYLRDGSEHTVDVTLQARPTPEARSQTAQNDNGVHLGILASNMTGEIASAMNLPENTEGVLVVQVQPGSIADRVGLRESHDTAVIAGQDVPVGGDVITSVNGHETKDIDSLKAVLADADPGQDLTLTVIRAGEKISITFTPNS